MDDKHIKRFTVDFNGENILVVYDARRPVLELTRKVRTVMQR